MDLCPAHTELCGYTDRFNEQIHALTAEHNVNVASRIVRDLHSVHRINPIDVPSRPAGFILYAATPSLQCV